MALTMGWLAFVGIRGPIDGHTHQPGVTLDEADDELPADQRGEHDHSKHGSEHGADVPDGWHLKELAGEAVQTATPAPSAGREPNSPSTVMGGEQPVTQDVEGVTPKPSPLSSQPSVSRLAPSDVKPDAKAPEIDASAATVPQSAPESASASEADAKSTVTVVTEESNARILTTEPEKDDFSVTSELSHLVSHFRPFGFAMAPITPPGLSRPDRLTPLEFEEPAELQPLGEVGQTPQPERHEQLQPRKLPTAPIKVTTLPEAFSL
ncbi:hypothetical protein [Streptomyces sp. NPDC059515]|uniref:hypothetical protein n=1 Tax=Streptomyces sp. NPDC059515 TaxID=3346854 RepID=UPI0036756591